MRKCQIQVGDGQPGADLPRLDVMDEVHELEDHAGLAAEVAVAPTREQHEPGGVRSLRDRPRKPVSKMSTKVIQALLADTGETDLVLRLAGEETVGPEDRLAFRR